MWSNISYYLSTVILTTFLICKTFFKCEMNVNKSFGIFIVIATVIFFLGNVVLYKTDLSLPFQTKQNYIYVQPGKKPIVIGWRNPLAQKII